MGLQFTKSDLSPFLYNGLISENFNLSGNVPVIRILLNVWVKVDDTYGALAFNILADISSYPYVFLGFSENIFFFQFQRYLYYQISLMGMNDRIFYANKTKIHYYHYY
jgi:hypothetical protein